MKKICFRVDANQKIGQGHAMRCLAVASYAQKNGIFDSYFVISDHESEKTFINSGFTYIIINSDYTDYTEKSAQVLLNIMASQNSHILFVDSYYIQDKFIRKIQLTYKTACFYYIEKKISADLIINYNINYNTDFYKSHYKNETSRLLLGSMYAPLREEFERPSLAPSAGKVRNILILTGGSDPYSVSSHISDIAELFPECKFSVIIGQYSNCKKKKQVYNVHYLPPSNKLAELMIDHDLVISAGGTTMYEICALRIPAIIYTFADNQKSESKYMGDHGYVKYAGDVREGTSFWNNLIACIRLLMNEHEMRIHMIERMHHMIDGQGCRRIVEALNQLEVINMDKDFEQTRSFWGNEIIRGSLIWPDEHVIRFVKRNYKDKENIVILDFGCGAGRNSVALASEGYRIIAMDYTDEAMKIVNAKKKNLPITTVKNTGFHIPLDAESVDVIVADGSLFYNSAANTIEILKNLKNVLKKDGKIWADWRSKDDSLYSKGVQLDNGLFRLNDSTQRNGCSYLFCSKDDIKYIYENAGLTIISIDDYKYTCNNGTQSCAYYHVIAKR